MKTFIWILFFCLISAPPCKAEVNGGQTPCEAVASPAAMENIVRPAKLPDGRIHGKASTYVSRDDEELSHEKPGGRWSKPNPNGRVRYIPPVAKKEKKKEEEKKTGGTETPKPVASPATRHHSGGASAAKAVHGGQSAPVARNQKFSWPVLPTWHAPKMRMPTWVPQAVQLLGVILALAFVAWVGSKLGWRRTGIALLVVASGIAIWLYGKTILALALVVAAGVGVWQVYKRWGWRPAACVAGFILAVGLALAVGVVPLLLGVGIFGGIGAAGYIFARKRGWI
ncbi:MAG: hypothetical protein KGI50_01395 [Patescibacteria group bacterium]|nr:hypothetical protein [Patescibacteria group bacterium]MDE2437997.1 hypothetical protein [Patescibacteria group bacterium]